MLLPISISRSSLILQVKGSKTFVSTTFIAYFGNGIEKFLNKKEWVLTSLLKDGEQGLLEPVNTYLSNDECCLYYKDWSNVPFFGLWDKHYPKQTV
jgi:hypothetical protein